MAARPPFDRRNLGQALVRLRRAHLVERGAVLTSRLVACPEGITRATVLEICRDEAIPHVERDLSLTEVYRADEAFRTGTMGELAPIVDVDGRTIGQGKLGPVTDRLLALFRARTEAEGEPIA